MEFQRKQIRLKDGRAAILRAPREADAEEMVAYIKTMSGETDFVLRYPEECDLSVGQEAAFLASTLASPQTLMIVCEVDGRIAGNCQLNQRAKIKTAHRAGIAIGLLKEYWHLGIGTAMFEEMIRVAREKGVMQLELEVIEGNERAMGLYRKMGFEVAATHPNFIRLKSGVLLNEYLMTLTLR